jgi:hypothetical protein
LAIIDWGRVQARTIALELDVSLSKGQPQLVKPQTSIQFPQVSPDTIYGAKGKKAAISA